MKLLDNLIGPVADVLKEVIPDGDKRAQLAHDIAVLAETQAHDEVMGQIEINKIEAQSDKWWKAGWRPFIGWVCGVSLAYHFVVQAFFEFILGIIIYYSPSSVPQAVFTAPTLEVEVLISLLVAMLGMGSYRTAEKIKGMKNG